MQTPALEWGRARAVAFRGRSRDGRIGAIWRDWGLDMIATISDAMYALLVTGGCFIAVMLVLLLQAVRPARLRSRREHREVKRRVIAELERRQEEQLERMRDSTGARHSEAVARYLELQNSIDFAKRI